MLQPRVQALKASTVKPLAVDRMRGSAWMEKRDRIMKRDHGLCRCDECAKLIAPRIAHEVDHRVELVDGGTDDDDNLQALNRDCHARKSAAARKARGQTR
jgi:5-methylcytosine-specific restriction protein A